MIQGKDLRIGNLILVDGKVVEVENVSEYGINGQSWSDTHYGNQSGGFDYDFEFGKNKIEGIPLTEELLIEAGFKQQDMADLGIATYLEISPDISLSWDVKLGDNIWIGEFKTPVQYVHQLQNLYFCLTGEELTFNL